MTEFEEVELLETDLANLFESPQVNMRYNKVVYDGQPRITSTKSGFVFMHGSLSTSFLEYEATDSKDFATIEEYDVAPYQIRNVYKSEGFISLWVYYHGDIQIFLKDDCTEIFRNPFSRDVSSPLQEALIRFLDAFGRGIVERHGNQLSYLSNDAKVVLDLQRRTLTKFYHDLTIGAFNRPTAKFSVTVTAEFLRLQKIPATFLNGKTEVFALPTGPIKFNPNGRSSTTGPCPLHNADKV